MRCKSCGKDTPATLCNVCFLDEVITAVEGGEDDPSKILRGMAAEYGRLKHLDKLTAYRAIFGAQKLRRVITTESGERCKLVPSLSGWVAVSGGRQVVKRDVPEEDLLEDYFQTAEGSRVSPTPGEHRKIYLTPESTEGGRIITYYKGDAPIKEVRTSTALVFPKERGRRKGKYITSGPPSPHYKSPLAHDRPPSPLDE